MTKSYPGTHTFRLAHTQNYRSDSHSSCHQGMEKSLLYCKPCIPDNLDQYSSGSSNYRLERKKERGELLAHSRSQNMCVCVISYVDKPFENQGNCQLDKCSHSFQHSNSVQLIQRWAKERKGRSGMEWNGTSGWEHERQFVEDGPVQVAQLELQPVVIIKQSH